jgi:hypothetical protein
MSGKGAPSQTLFGVIGQTAYDPLMKSLGGLVTNTKSSGGGNPTQSASSMPQTQRSILGPVAKTPMPGEHYGQVPYAGAYQSKEGERL